MYDVFFYVVSHFLVGFLFLVLILPDGGLSGGIV